MMDGIHNYHPTVVAMYSQLELDISRVESHNFRRGAAAMVDRFPDYHPMVPAMFPPLETPIYTEYSQRTLLGHMKRLSRFYYWLEDNTNEQTRHTTLYSRVGIHTIKAFLRSVEPRGQAKHDTMREYFSSIVWDTRVRQQALPLDFHVEVKSFIRRCPKVAKFRKIWHGAIRLVVLFARAKKRANHRIYCPGGKGYERCRKEYYYITNTNM